MSLSYSFAQTTLNPALVNPRSNPPAPAKKDTTSIQFSDWLCNQYRYLTFSKDLIESVCFYCTKPNRYAVLHFNNMNTLRMPSLEVHRMVHLKNCLRHLHDSNRADMGKRGHRQNLRSCNMRRFLHPMQPVNFLGQW